MPGETRITQLAYASVIVPVNNMRKTVPDALGLYWLKTREYPATEDLV